MRLFTAMGLQWRIGFEGPVGLDYAVLDFVARRLFPPVRVDWRMLRQIQCLEAVQLESWARRRDRRPEE